ncbi:MAG: DUF1905 domain-containing protein [Acidimicrobiia bacterium]|nr:DUF1905 domain-containing protein [Acidimicrobiia bacterium]
MDHEFSAELWEYEGEAPWVFVTLPADLADEIEDQAPRGGFGSVKVEVNCGQSLWSTSLFPDKKSASFVLPVKKEIRIAEGLSPGDQARFKISVVRRASP